ncbi:MAG: hypothetical protein QF415_06700 [Candidatus Undinarchaeales archaeon]|nr:hypothetical protein [Candidatus Undinarchaeales archaeon]MDP7492667.1 hypothetical protein [Candidatus Undinarchaeales archaeon]
MPYLEVALNPGDIISDLYTDPRITNAGDTFPETTQYSLKAAISPEPYQSGERPISYGLTDVYRIDEYGTCDVPDMDRSVFQVEVCRRVTRGDDGQPVVHEEDAYAVLYLNSPDGTKASAVRSVVVGSPGYRDYKVSHLDGELPKGYTEGNMKDVLTEMDVVIDDRVDGFLSDVLPGYASAGLACAWGRQATTVLESIAYQVGPESDPDAPIIIENYHAKLDVDGTDDPYFNVAFRVREDAITSDFGSGEWYARRHEKMKPVIGCGPGDATLLLEG